MNTMVQAAVAASLPVAVAEGSPVVGVPAVIPGTEVNTETLSALNIPLTEVQAKVADSCRAEVLATITSLDTSTKGATKAAFNVLRSVSSYTDADKVFTRLEYDWREAHKDADGKLPPIPGSWRTMKSAMMRRYSELPELLKKAPEAVKRNLARDSITDKAEIDRHLSLFFLDSPAKLQPLAFGPDGHAQWAAALSKLKAAIAKDVKAANDKGAKGTGTETAIIPENDTREFPSELIRVRARLLRAIRDAVDAEVPSQELVAMIERTAVEVERRTTARAEAQSKRAKLEGAAPPKAGNQAKAG